MSSSEWKKQKIQDILLKVVDNRGKNPPFSDQGYPYIDTTCIVGDSRRIDYSLVRKYVSEETYETWFRSGHPIADDLLIATVGANIGKICLMDDSKVCIAQNTVGLRINKDLANPVYVYYLLSSTEIQAYLKSLDVGSAQPSIKVPHLLNVAIDLPPLPTQRRISDILSALDEKIELNRQTNSTLEAIAQAIFKEWFVDFNFPGSAALTTGGATGELVESELGLIPSGWRVGKLKEIAIQRNERINASTETELMPYVPIDVISSRSLFLSDSKSGTEAKTSLIKFYESDILFGAMRPYFHKVCIAPFDGTTRTTAFVFYPRLEIDYSYMTIVLHQPSTIEYASKHSTGSTIPYAQWTNSLSEMSILLPTAEVRHKFNALIKPILSAISPKYFENQSITQIRNSLLPKLMTGEIKV